MRDEDGKTPLDKARERGDEGHREVIQILQSPGEYMVPVNRDGATAPTPDAPEPEKVPEPAQIMEQVSEPKGNLVLPQ